jgi:hypothetical protein
VRLPEDHVLAILADVVCHPVRHCVWNWNWKSSVSSALCRAAIFFCLNAPAGMDSALRAMMTELIYRAIASGVLGSLTQALRHSRPRLAALLLLPAIGHLFEYLVHLQAGTPRLETSIAASITFSVITTSFNLFAMRRGALIVGQGQQSLLADMARLPGLIVAFVVCGVRPLRRLWAHSTDTSPCP